MSEQMSKQTQIEIKSEKEWQWRQENVRSFDLLDAGNMFTLVYEMSDFGTL